MLWALKNNNNNNNNFHQLRRGQRDMFLVPENLGAVAAVQRCPTPRLFAVVRLRGLSIVRWYR